jgi:hypothetical protein
MINDITLNLTLTSFGSYWIQPFDPIAVILQISETLFIALTVDEQSQMKLGIIAAMGTSRNHHDIPLLSVICNQRGQATAAFRR